MNIVLELVSICLLNRNILVPTYFDVPFQIVSGFHIYIYIYIRNFINISENFPKDNK